MKHIFSGDTKEQYRQVVSALENTNAQMQDALRYTKSQAKRDNPHLTFAEAKRRLIWNLNQANSRLVDELTRLDAED